MSEVPADPRRELILAELRTASLQARLYLCQVDAIGKALGANIISTQRAIVALHDLGYSLMIDPQPGDRLAGIE